MTLDDELRLKCEARCGRTVGAVLLEARGHVGGGWSEPLSLDASGVMCGPTDEGISRFSVADALAIASRFDAQLDMYALHALIEALQTSAWVDWHTWLNAPTRTQDEVVRLFGRAMTRTRAKESR